MITAADVRTFATGLAIGGVIGLVVGLLLAWQSQGRSLSIHHLFRRLFRRSPAVRFDLLLQ